MAFEGSRVTVTDEPTPLFAADPGGGSFAALIRNRSAHPVDVGGRGVASGEGFELLPGDTIPAQLGAGDILYGVVAEDLTAAVHILRGA